MIRNTAQRLALTVLMLTLAFLLAALPYATASAQSPPSPPTVLGGTAWLDGQLVPPGTLIQAMQGSTQLSRITARTNGRFGPLQVSKPPGAGPVYFLVNGQRADIEMHWRAGFLQADLELRAGLGAQPAPAAAATATPRPAPTARPENLRHRPRLSLRGREVSVVRRERRAQLDRRGHGENRGSPARTASEVSGDQKERRARGAARERPATTASIPWAQPGSLRCSRWRP